MSHQILASKTKPFTKILIANRGEIACRIISTAQRLGIQCVAIYSDVDKYARHVSMADEAFHVGPAPAIDSYLNSQRILTIAIVSNAQAIHPGYGFLSENAQFAQACAQQGITFIGPSIDAITTMGSKSAAKAIMSAAKVPLVPGYHGQKQDIQTLTTHSKNIGYPQLLKAVYGGGGKGMRIVNQASEFNHALTATKREAMTSFGNDDMLIESYITKTRHIEIQIFSDNHGNCIYLAQRDCSIQRRHQKILEEAPAPALPMATQIAMGEAAVAAAQAINYRGAGTVEFLYDENGHFYFMEMNTRLQVEHPVTEMITGLDLVEWQLYIANDEPLPLTQAEVGVNGHAIEVRIYAEDPDNDFMPASGNIAYLHQPSASKHVRIDTGVHQGDEISPFYDPMIAKLIVWDHNRELALLRLQSALSEYRITGIKTNIDFLTQLAQVPALHKAMLNTDFIITHADALLPKSINLAYAYVLSGIALQLQQDTVSEQTSPWDNTSGWRLNQPAVNHFKLTTVQDENCTVSLTNQGQGFHVQLSGFKQNSEQQIYIVSGTLNGNELTAFIDGHRIKVTIIITTSDITLFYSGKHIQLLRQPKLSNKTLSPNPEQELATKITAPMNGIIVSVLCQPNQEVEAGEPLVVMEAMKMECNITAPTAGTISSVFYQDGDMVEDGAELIQLTPSLALDKKEQAS